MKIKMAAMVALLALASATAAEALTVKSVNGIVTVTRDGKVLRAIPGMGILDNDTIIVLSREGKVDLGDETCTESFTSATLVPPPSTICRGRGFAKYMPYALPLAVVIPTAIIIKNKRNSSSVSP